MASPLRYSQEGPSNVNNNSVNAVIFPDQDEIWINKDYANIYLEELKSNMFSKMVHSETKRQVKINIIASPTHTYITSGRVISREYGLLEPTEVALMWMPGKNVFRCRIIGRVVTDDDPIILSSDAEDAVNTGNVISDEADNNDETMVLFGEDYENFGKWDYGWSIIATPSIASGEIPLHVPKHISLKKMDMMQESIKLIDDSGNNNKEYHCNIITSKNNLAKKKIGGGWFEYIKDHNVQVGDAMLFTIWNPPTTFAVKHIRHYKFM